MSVNWFKCAAGRREIILTTNFERLAREYYRVPALTQGIVAAPSLLYRHSSTIHHTSPPTRLQHMKAIRSAPMIFRASPTMHTPWHTLSLVTKRGILIPYYENWSSINLHFWGPWRIWSQNTKVMLRSGLARCLSGNFGERELQLYLKYDITGWFIPTRIL